MSVIAVLIFPVASRIALPNKAPHSESAFNHDSLSILLNKPVLHVCIRENTREPSFVNVQMECVCDSKLGAQQRKHRYRVWHIKFEVIILHVFTFCSCYLSTVQLCDKYSSVGISHQL